VWEQFLWMQCTKISCLMDARQECFCVYLHPLRHHPPFLFQPLPERPAPEDRRRRVGERKAALEASRKRIREEVQVDTGEELVGKGFYDDDLGLCTVTEWETHNGHQVVWYKHSRTDSSGEFESCSSVVEVREWCEE
jgi:hypothetical protein